MATLDNLDDWRLDFDLEIDEPVTNDQDENLETFFDNYLEAFERIDINDMTMH